MRLPRSRVPSAEGVIAVLTLEVKLTVSVVASPKITLPLNVDIPVTRRLPLTVEVDEVKERILLLVPPEFLTLIVVVPLLEVL